MGLEWVNMKTLCQTLLEQYAERAARQKVTIDLALPPESACVVGFGTLLGDALDKLMRRALDAMPDGGLVTMQLRVGRDVSLEICDTGNAGVMSGTRAARVIVQAHGGRWQRRPAEDGACFVIDLPKAGSRTQAA